MKGASRSFFFCDLFFMGARERREERERCTEKACECACDFLSCTVPPALAPSVQPCTARGLSVCLSFCLSRYLCLYLCLFVSLPACISVSLPSSVSLPLCRFVCLSLGLCSSLSRRFFFIVMQLVELLEVPQLMDACVRSDLWEEALSIATFASTLERRHRNRGAAVVPSRCEKKRLQRGEWGWGESGVEILTLAQLPSFS